jgi:hypothetical protein
VTCDNKGQKKGKTSEIVTENEKVRIIEYNRRNYQVSISPTFYVRLFHTKVSR